MKAFFEEYGMIIVTCVVVITLIAIAVFLRTPIQGALAGLVNEWAGAFDGALNVTGITVNA